MKRVFIVHRWGGSPESDWYAWLKKELEKKGFNVSIPKMPNADEPKIDEWVKFLAKQVKKADKETYFVGHSVGCQTILRYLEKANKQVGGVVFVAGWFNLMGLGDEEKSIAKPWLETPIDFEKVKSATKKFVAIFSDNDPYVPLKDAEVFRKKLGAKIIMENKKGHFTGEDGVKELKLVLDELLKMSS